MFSRKQIAAASGLLGGLVMTCTGSAQANAAGSAGTCPVDAQGNTTCIQRTIQTPDGERYLIRQDRCVPVQPLTLPNIPLLNTGTKRLGPEVTCNSNNPSNPSNPSSPNMTPTAGENENALEVPGGLVGRVLGS